MLLTARCKGRGAKRAKGFTRCITFTGVLSKVVTDGGLGRTCFEGEEVNDLWVLTIRYSDNLFVVVQAIEGILDCK